MVSLDNLPVLATILQVGARMLGVTLTHATAMTQASDYQITSRPQQVESLCTTLTLLAEV
jgi:hypothetical protein